MAESKSDIQASDSLSNKQEILPGPDLTIPSRPAEFDKWIEHFYKECGREVTLAYTTLNQMKNWAIVIAGALLSGFAFGTSAITGSIQQFPNRLTFAGTTLVFLFVLRFFVRAILCYINLLRWNRLQTECVETYLLPRTKDTGRTRDKAEAQLQEAIRVFYFGWASPINRTAQLLSNLKLGFGLIFALVLFFLVWGGVTLWSDQFVKALTVFTVGATFIEAVDFFQSPYFDDPEARKRREGKKQLVNIFPVPRSHHNYAIWWLGLVALTSVVADWERVELLIKRLFHFMCS